MDSHQMNEVNPYSNGARKRSRVFLIIATVALFCLLFYTVVKYVSTLDLFNTRRTIAYNEMVYQRPDTDKIFEKIDDIIELVSGKESFYKKLKALRSLEKDYENFYTMQTLAYIKHKSDNTDEFFKGENDFFGEVAPKFQQKLEELFVACSKSSHAKRFELEYFGEGFFDSYKNGSVYSDNFVKLLQEESRLVNEYIAAVSHATINYNGKEETLETILQRGLDEEEFDALMAMYYEKYNDILGEIYVDLVKIRLSIAKELGYESYIDYAYEYYGRDYTAEQASLFIQDVKRVLVPLYKRVKQDELFRIFEETPRMDEKRVFKIVKKAAKEMSSKTGDIFSYMEKYGLYDISASPNKAPGSFQTYIAAYDAPFILMNPEGDAYDVLVFAHEFGHFVDSYLNYDYTVSIEDAEVASQSMGYLVLNYLTHCTEEEENILFMMQFLKTLDLYISQGYYNEFEERVYSLSENEVILENINSIANQCAVSFGLYDDEWKDYYSLQWVDIIHFYELPFYV
ncbi:MAG: M3 family oligoendopeptidase, partial [Clostridiaceae bacterium]|nr:M3 family oligoendopeptidase [Clostridiaceae bacterium]